MNRDETNRRLELLRKRIRNGKFHVAPHLREGFEASLGKIRVAPDGLVDEATVDGRIRSTLLLIAYQADRDGWKDRNSLPRCDLLDLLRAVLWAEGTTRDALPLR